MALDVNVRSSRSSDKNLDRVQDGELPAPESQSCRHEHLNNTAHIVIRCVNKLTNIFIYFHLLTFKLWLTFMLCLHVGSGAMLLMLPTWDILSSGPGPLSEPETEWFLEITYSDITMENLCFNCRKFKHLNIQNKTRWSFHQAEKNKMAAKYFRCISPTCESIT